MSGTRSSDCENAGTFMSISMPKVSRTPTSMSGAERIVASRLSACRFGRSVIAATANRAGAALQQRFLDLPSRARRTLGRQAEQADEPLHLLGVALRPQGHAGRVERLLAVENP